MITVADLIAYRRRHDKLIERVVEAQLPTQFGDFTVVGFRSLVDDKHHVAMVKGEVDGERGRARARPLRVPHRRRLPLAALRLRPAARGRAGAHRARRAAACCSTSPRRGAASACSTSCAPTSSRSRAATRSTPTSSSACRPTCATTASARRSWSTSGLSSIRLLTNNPKKIVGLEGYGLSVTDQIPIEHAPGDHNRDYLRAKKDRMGHLLHHQGLAARRGDDPRGAGRATAPARRPRPTCTARARPRGASGE